MIACFGCQQQATAENNPEQVLAQVEPKPVPKTEVAITNVAYKPNESLWKYNDQPYSGYVIERHEDGSSNARFGVLNGKKQDTAYRWYADGHLQEVAYYHENKLHGIKKNWASDSIHNLVSQLNYHLGKLNGEQRKWYGTGELYKLLNMSMGKEEGMQQAFRPNGDLYVNYEARNGRTFGLKRSSLCYELEDEAVQYPDRN